MRDLATLFKNKRNLVNFLVLLILVVTIPVVLNLIRSQQILKGRALGSPPVEVVGPVALAPATPRIELLSGQRIGLILDTNQPSKVDLRLTSPLGPPGGNITPFPTTVLTGTPIRTPTPSLRPSPSPTLVAGANKYKYATGNSAAVCASTLINATLRTLPAQNFDDISGQVLTPGINYFCAQIFAANGTTPLTGILTQTVTHILPSIPTPTTTQTPTTAPTVVAPTTATTATACDITGSASIAANETKTYTVGNLNCNGSCRWGVQLNPCTFTNYQWFSSTATSLNLNPTAENLTGGNACNNQYKLVFQFAGVPNVPTQANSCGFYITVTQPTTPQGIGSECFQYPPSYSQSIDLEPCPTIPGWWRFRQ